MNLHALPTPFHRLTGRLARSFWAALALLCATATAAWADDYSEIQQLLSAGQTYRAQALAERHISANPRDPQMRFLLAEVLAQLGQRPAAIEVLQRLVSEYPELPEPYNNLAALYAQDQQYEKARTALEMALTANPRYATAMENLGDVYAKLASERYAQALGLSPASATLPLKIDRLTQVFGPATEAAAPLEPALSTDPVAQALQLWAQAWSQRDMTAYLARYAPDFQPPKSQTLADWRTERFQRISTKKRIQISLKNLRVDYPSANTARATFLQNYQADGLSLVQQKVIELRREGKHWLILRESSAE